MWWLLSAALAAEQVILPAGTPLFAEPEGEEVARTSMRVAGRLEATDGDWFRLGEASWACVDRMGLAGVTVDLWVSADAGAPVLTEHLEVATETGHIEATAGTPVVDEALYAPPFRVDVSLPDAMVGTVYTVPSRLEDPFAGGDPVEVEAGWSLAVESATVVVTAPTVRFAMTDDGLGWASGGCAAVRTLRKNLVQQEGDHDEASEEGEDPSVSVSPVPAPPALKSPRDEPRQGWGTVERGTRLVWTDGTEAGKLSHNRVLTEHTIEGDQVCFDVEAEWLAEPLPFCVASEDIQRTPETCWGVDASEICDLVGHVEPERISLGVPGDKKLRRIARKKSGTCDATVAIDAAGSPTDVELGDQCSGRMAEAATAVLEASRWAPHEGMDGSVAVRFATSVTLPTE